MTKAVRLQINKSKKKITTQTVKPANIISLARPKKVDPSKMGVVDSIVYIFSKNGTGKKAQSKHLAAAIMGGIVGGIVPIGAAIYAHIELKGIQTSELFTKIPFYFVIGALLYSAPTVYEWVKSAVGSDTVIGKIKPFGWVLLIEGSMAYPSESVAAQVFAVVSLLILVFINAIASGCTLALRRTLD